MLYYLQAVLLGIVQGVTEPLPVSSTAHLDIIERLFHLDQTVYGLTFDMFINIGTTAAVISFFWKDIVKIFRHLRWPFGITLTKEQRLPWIVLIATIPAGIAGLLLEKRIASDFRSPLIVAFSLVAVALVMIWAERKSQGGKGADEPTDRQAYGIGLAQALAVIPGVSRSGITVATGLGMGLSRVAAAEYSFLLSVPITLAAILKRGAKFAGEVHHHQVDAHTIAFYLVGAVASYVTAFFTLRFLLKYYEKSTLTVFAYYRIALAIFIVLIFR